MLEIIIFTLSLAMDQLVKYWSVTQLANMPVQTVPIIGRFLQFRYAENRADNVSFIRGRSMVMNIVRILQVVLVLYLLIRHRKKLATITRVALILFLAGLIGNQMNYLFMNYVPDMFTIWLIPNIVFNVADVFVFVAMIILFVRLAFFEGQDLINWIVDRGTKSNTDE